VLLAFAVILSLVALADLVAVVIMVTRGDWALAASALRDTSIVSFLALVVWWVATRLLGGTLSANRVTVLRRALFRLSDSS
jgi:hypothetical protein